MMSPPPRPPERWIVRVHDRPASVERVLGTLRRRRVEIDDLAVARSSGSSMVVVVAAHVGAVAAARVCAELRASPDVIEVERSTQEDVQPENHEPNQDGIQ